MSYKMVVDFIAGKIILSEYLYNVICNNSFDDSALSYGDVMIVETDFAESRLIRPLCPKISGIRYTHFVFKTEKNYAEGLDLDGRIKYNLRNIPYEWKSFLAFRHNEINDEKRKEFKRINEELSDVYDLGAAWKMLAKRIMGKKPNLEDLSLPNKFMCPSRFTYIYDLLELPISEEVHWSQTEMIHVANSRHFKKVGSWKRK